MEAKNFSDSRNGKGAFYLDHGFREYDSKMTDLIKRSKFTWSGAKGEDRWRDIVCVTFFWLFFL